jgi:hypothetical protein
MPCLALPGSAAWCGYPAPTREPLVWHLEKFMPKGREEQRHHRQAVEAVAAEYRIDLYGTADPVVAAKSRTRKRVSVARQNKRAQHENLVEEVAG